MVEEDKTYENEVEKPKKDTKCCGEHGGKRPGAGRQRGLQWAPYRQYNKKGRKII